MVQLLGAGQWRLGERRGWPDNPSYLNLVAWGWRLGEDRRLIEVNLSDTRSQGFVFLPWEDLAGKPWRLSEVFNGEVYDRDGNEILESGLFVDLEPWQFHFFRFIL